MEQDGINQQEIVSLATTERARNFIDQYFNSLMEIQRYNISSSVEGRNIYIRDAELDSFRMEIWHAIDRLGLGCNTSTHEHRKSLILYNTLPLCCKEFRDFIQQCKHGYYISDGTESGSLEWK